MKKLFEQFMDNSDDQMGVIDGFNQGVDWAFEEQEIPTGGGTAPKLKM
jgi:hypothetical protein